MKLKAVISRGCSSTLRDAIEGMRQEVMDEVIGPHLKRPKFGPAEFYIQECDLAVSEQGFCEVRLSGVSLSKDRSEQDFDNARQALEDLYQRKIRSHLLAGHTYQLMVSIMLDGPRRCDGSSLVEGRAIWVDGTVIKD